MLPSILLCVFGDWLLGFERLDIRFAGLVLAAAAVFHVVGLGVVHLPWNGELTPAQLYRMDSNMDDQVEQLGLWTMLRLDVKHMIFPPSRDLDADFSGLEGLGGGDAADLHGEADVFQTRPLHQQVEALEDHGDLPAGQPQLPFREGRHLLPVHDDGARGGPLQQVHAPHQGALACSGEADDPEDLPLLNVQIDILQRVDSVFPGAEGLVQVLDLDDGHGITLLSEKSQQKSP